jgi:hypothetical protein
VQISPNGMVLSLRVTKEISRTTSPVPCGAMNRVRIPRTTRIVKGFADDAKRFHHLT